MNTTPGLAVTAATGDRVATLQSLRDCLAVAIEEAESSRDIAALSRQLTMVMAEITTFAPPVEKKGTPLDELRARRASRVSAPKTSRRPTKSAV